MCFVIPLRCITSLKIVSPNKRNIAPGFTPQRTNMANVTIGEGAGWDIVNAQFNYDRWRMRFEEARDDSITDPDNRELLKRWEDAYRSLGKAKRYLETFEK